MPITELTNDYLEQHCAPCGASRRLTSAQLQLGEGLIDATEDPYVLAFAPCAQCGAREFVIASRGESSNQRSLHQRLVDELLARVSGRAEAENSLALYAKEDAGMGPAHITEGGT